MNIFVVDVDPRIAAISLCDSHVCKQIVESCQMLSTYDRLHMADPEEGVHYSNGRYKITHVHHPCVKCLSNKYNYMWLQYHLDALLCEYTWRFGGRIHKSSSLFEDFWKRFDMSYVYDNKLNFKDYWPELINGTSFPKCMPDEFKVGGDTIDKVVESYRNYYKHKKQTLKRFRYSARLEPAWLKGD